MRLHVIGWTVGGAMLTLIMAGLGWGLIHPANKTPATLVGKPAPQLSIRTFDGRIYDLAQLSGTPIVLNFWASWCVACRQEAPVLGAAAKQYAGRVQFIGADIQDSDQAARTYEAEIKDPYPVGPIVRGTYHDFGVTAPPETFFIDRQGNVISQFAGPFSDKFMAIYISQLQP
jgi:cytochrome c biogenesis protein CcmG/thiol:disulfide interchange protein DsbE